MVTLDDISLTIISLVRVGAVFRFIYCMVRMGATEDELTMYQKRVKNTIIFYICAESVWQIKDIVMYYFS